MKKRWWIVRIAGLALIGITVVSIVVPLIRSVVTPSQSVAIIGGADGPTTVFLTQRLFWELMQGRVWSILVGVILIAVAVVLKITTKKS